MGRIRTTVTLGLAVLLAASVYLQGCRGDEGNGSQTNHDESQGRVTSVSGVSGNLIVNGDAEFGASSASGYDGVTLPGWETVGVPTVVGYANASGFPDAATPGPDDRGANFFAGGPVGNASLQQFIDVSSAAADIDSGTVTFDLAGWLGGYAYERAAAKLTVKFQGIANDALGSATIGPVTVVDRWASTSFQRRSTQGSVPAGTRRIRVQLDLEGDPVRNLLVQSNDAYADNLSLTLSLPLPGASPPDPAPSTVPALDHVFFVIMENEGFGAVIDNTAAPYLNELAANNVTLANSYALVHPSNPNYIAVAGGSAFGRTDNPPLTLAIDAPHIGDRVEEVGREWRAYVEGANGPCDGVSHDTPTGKYYPDNVPFWFFADMKAPARCAARLHPIEQLWADLGTDATTPAFVWFEPNGCNMMHDCSVATGDAWMKANLPKLFASEAWTKRKSLLVITWDEDHYFDGQHIPTILAGSPGLLRSGFVSNLRYDHYSIARTMEEALGLRPLTKNDRYAKPLNDIWQRP